MGVNGIGDLVTSVCIYEIVGAVFPFGQNLYLNEGGIHKIGHCLGTHFNKVRKECERNELFQKLV
jgi:hypothetical protein